MKKNLLFILLGAVGSEAKFHLSIDAMGGAAKAFGKSKSSMYEFLAGYHRSIGFDKFLNDLAAEEGGKRTVDDVKGKNMTVTHDDAKKAKNGDKAALEKCQDVHGLGKEYSALLRKSDAENGEAEFIENSEKKVEEGSYSGTIGFVGPIVNAYFYAIDKFGFGAHAGVLLPFGSIKEKSVYLENNREVNTMFMGGFNVAYNISEKISVEGSMFGALYSESVTTSLHRGNLTKEYIEKVTAKYKEQGKEFEYLMEHYSKAGQDNTTETARAVSFGLGLIGRYRFTNELSVNVALRYLFGREAEFADKNKVTYAKLAMSSSRDTSQDLDKKYDEGIIGDRSKRPGLALISLGVTYHVM